MTFSLIYVFLTRTTTRFGTPALAALGIGHRVESWLFMIGVGFGAATAAIVGQNLGAGRADRADARRMDGHRLCTLLGVVAFALELVFAATVRVAVHDDPAVIAEAAKYLRIAAISQLAVCAEIVLEGALGGAGETVPPMLASTALTASRIPLAAWAASRWGSVGHLVGDLADGDRAGGRDGRPLARWPLEAQSCMTIPMIPRPVLEKAVLADARRSPDSEVGRSAGGTISNIRIITLLTDFGTADGYVGEMKGVLLSARARRDARRRHARYAAAGRRARAAHARARLAPLSGWHGASRRRRSRRREYARRARASRATGAFSSDPTTACCRPRCSFRRARVVELPLPSAASATFHGRDVFAPVRGGTRARRDARVPRTAGVVPCRSSHARADSARERRARRRSDPHRPLRQLRHEPLRIRVRAR